jgi:hypothetical protein
VEGIERKEQGYNHDFGAMEKGGNGEHTFYIRNAGTGPLTIAKGEFTCTCTLAQLGEEKDKDQVEVPPGGSIPIVFRWTPKVGMSDHFMTQGELVTNDPVSKTLTIVITGNIVPAIRTLPEDLVLDGISTSEPHTAIFKIYDYRGGPLGVKEYRLDKAETAEYYEITHEPLSPEEVIAEPGAKGGIGFAVTLKSGLPLGPFHQTIHVTLDRESAEEIVVPIRGRVVGDITFLGPGYDANEGYVKVGTISSETGFTRTMHVMVKGPDRNEVDLQITRIRPEGLIQAKLGEPRSINDGAVVMIPLEVTIPPGSPPGDHIGNTPGSMGLVQLESTGPNPKKALLYLSFLIEKSK